MKKALIISTLSLSVGLLFPIMSSAAEMEDVIYLNNGSIIRGIIVENRPGDGVYKIQSSNGNVFVYQTDDIDKITKEAKSGSSQGGVVVNINNNNTNTNNNDNKSAATAQAISAAPVATRRSHAIGVGSYAISFSDTSASAASEENSTSWQGVSINYQYGFNNHLAIRAHFYAVEHEEFSASKISGYEAQILLSTNVQEIGWKFYIGGGGFQETSKFDGSDKTQDFSGGMFVLGLGYNFDRVAVDLDIGVRSVDDYVSSGDSPEDVGVTGGALSLAFRY